MKNLIYSCIVFLIASTTLFAQDATPGTYENGQVKAEGALQGGKKVGEWKFFHDNGQPMRQGVYQAGEPIGVWKEYYRSGQVKSEGKYVISHGNGVKNGLWTTYHKNGAKEFEGKFEAGKQVGTWIEYNTLGIEIKKINH